MGSYWLISMICKTEKDAITFLSLVNLSAQLLADKAQLFSAG